MPTDTSQARRLNIMIGENLLQWASTAAKERGMSVSALIRHSLEVERDRSREQELERAADAMSQLYDSDEGLNDTRVLDGEDFV